MRVKFVKQDMANIFLFQCLKFTFTDAEMLIKFRVRIYKYILILMGAKYSTLYCSVVIKFILACVK